MPQNPSLSRATTPRGAGMIHQDGLNNSQPYNPQGYNTFDRSNLRLMTQRFADIHPYFYQKAVDGDVIRKRDALDLSTYTMKSKVLTPVNLHLDSFTVPYSAIMPNTWELVVKEPVKGDDIPDNVYPVWEYGRFAFYFKNFLDAAFAGTLPAFLSNVDALRIFVANCFIFSSDGLLKSLGVSTPIEKIADELFAEMVSELVNSTFAMTVDGTDIETLNFSSGQLFNLFDRWFKGDIDITNADSLEWSSLIQTVSDSIVDFNERFVRVSEIVDTDNGTFRSSDTLRILAYQMTCAQFYSNSHIDDIFTGKLYLQNLFAFVDSFSDVARVFRHNGVNHSYDMACKFMWDTYVNFNYMEQRADNFRIDSWFYLVSNLFSFRSSLRQPDYFIESRLQPLASGDFNVAVGEEGVSVIDVNAKMWSQRLANAVNRTSSEINRYLANILGVERQRIDPQPNYVCSETLPLNSDVVENTGAAQISQPNAQTSRMGKFESKYMFEIFIDEPSVVISLSSFSAMYAYPRAIDKDADYRDRMDDFNPFLQHVGDQNVYAHELDAERPYTENFGFQLRYAQFKNGLSIATGGFSAGVLPSWALLYEEYEPLSSSFIRNRNEEFDKLYNSLTYFDPGRRFHFVMSIWNAASYNSRQQAYPTLL